MTKENKLKIGLALNGIALLVGDATFQKIKDRLDVIEEIVSAEPDDTTQNCVENALGALDCISRDAVWEVMQELWGTSGELLDRLMALPSVNPQEPKADVLDKIIAEIENYVCNQEENTMKAQGMLNALGIIDKYKAESEG